MEAHTGGKILHYLHMFKLTQISVVEPNGTNEWSNVELCQQVSIDNTSGDGERMDVGAAT